MIPVAFRWAIGLAIIVVLLLRFDLHGVLAALQRVNLGVAAPAIVGLTIVHLLGAAAWRDLAFRLADFKLGWRATITHYYAAQAVGGITPANVGADAYRLAAVRVEGAGWSALLLPIVAQRLTSYIALSGLALGALTILWSSTAARMVVAAGVTIAIGSTILLTFLYWRPVSAASRYLSRRLRWDLATTELARRRWRGALVSGTAIALIFHAVSVTLVYLLVTAVRADTPLAPVMAAVAIARLSIVIPISPSGLGIQEAALSVLFLEIGLPAETALAAALLNRVSLLITTALGTAFILLQHSRSRRRGGPAAPVTSDS